jgi:hypothetical protein
MFHLLKMTCGRLSLPQAGLKLENIITGRTKGVTDRMVRPHLETWLGKVVRT